MAKPKKTAQSSTLRWKQKRWFHIKAPKLFNEQTVGETPAESPDLLYGKRIKVNLMNLTRDIKKQNYKVTFEIIKSTGDTLYTNFYGFEMNPASVRKMIRRKRTRIDSTLIVKTNDNVRVVLKPLLVTRYNVNTSLKSALSAGAREFLKEYASKVSYHQLANDISYFKVQRSMREALAKLYPLRSSEIRVMHFYRNKKQNDTPEETEIKKDLKVEVGPKKAETKEGEETEETTEKEETRVEAPKVEKKKTEEAPEVEETEDDEDEEEPKEEEKEDTLEEETTEEKKEE